MGIGFQAGIGAGAYRRSRKKRVERMEDHFYKGDAELGQATVDVEGNALKNNHEFVRNQYGDIVQRKKSSSLGGRIKQLSKRTIEEDPDKIYARMTRMEFNDYVKNYRDFEEDLIEKSQTDTTLIDQAREDLASTPALMQGVQQRQMDRYGTALTPAQQKAQRDAMTRQNTLSTIQGMSDARIAQREQNQGLLAQLIDIGQGVNRAAQDQMGGAAADATQRKNAYEQARAQHKAQTYSTLGSLGGMGVAFLMGF